MSKFKRETENRIKMEYETDLIRFKEFELGAMRVEEAQRNKEKFE